MSPVALKPVQSRAWRPGALGGVRAHSTPSRGLGQALPATQGTLSVRVVEISGRPVQDAAIEVFQGGSPVGSWTTGSDGAASLQLSRASYDVRVTYKGMVLVKKVTREEVDGAETVFFQFPICIVDPLFRGIDLAIFATAAGMIAAGTYWKFKPLQMTGEIALGAGIFGLIYRLQCV